MSRIAAVTLTTMLFAGCAAAPQGPQIVEVGVPVRCKAETPPEPVLYTPGLPEPLPEGMLDTFMAALLADTELLKAYSGQLLAALKSCK